MTDILNSNIKMKSWTSKTIQICNKHFLLGIYRWKFYVYKRKFKTKRDIKKTFPISIDVKFIWFILKQIVTITTTII